MLKVSTEDRIANLPSILDIPMGISPKASFTLVVREYNHFREMYFTENIKHNNTEKFKNIIEIYQ